MSANVPVMKPPREDVFAPDLYIPLFSMFTYIILAACNKFANGAFKPDAMYSMVWHPSLVVLPLTRVIKVVPS
jgi:hypothetical protein